tara:strand:+ start:231 stop:782 length:552 start_codon:yes stop_codon:yes gene_type:complete
MTHHRNTHSTRRPDQTSQLALTGRVSQPGPAPDHAPDPEAAARAAFEAGDAALRAGQTLNAGRWLRLSKSLLALGRDLEALARQKASAAMAFTPPHLNPEILAFEQECEADTLAIVIAREEGRPEPEPRHEEAWEDVDFYMRLRATQRANLFDEEAHRRGELDLDELDLDAWLPPAFRSGSGG